MFHVNNQEQICTPVKKKLQKRSIIDGKPERATDNEMVTYPVREHGSRRIANPALVARK